MKWDITAVRTFQYSINFIEGDRDITSLLDSTSTIIVVDEVVHTLYPNLFPDTNLLIVKGGETNKNNHTATQILDFFEKSYVSRRSNPIIAVGGGVLLDLVGYCCSIYRRGIPYIRIPTTLLSIVDASVGVKTGINIFNKRNRLGSYYPPLHTYIDTKFINTQEYRDISNGLAECLKLALVSDSLLFEMLETYKFFDCKLQNEDGIKIINRAISSMVNELKDNLWETNLKRSMDFGHSFSPLIEMKNVENMLHGESVILDCLLSSCLSVHRKLLSHGALERIFKVVRELKLPTHHRDFADVTLLKNSLDETSRHRDNNQNLPLLTSIGTHVFVNDVTQEDLTESVKLFNQYGK